MRRSRWPVTSTPDAAFALAERYFGEIPAGPVPAPVSAHGDAWRTARGSCSRIASNSRASTSPGTARRCLRATTPSSTSRRICWRTARRRGCISCWCTNSRSPTDVVAYQHSREISGVFQIATTAAPGVALGDLHTPRSRETLSELSSEQPTTDGARARARANRCAVHLSRADDRRLRRQVRSAQCLQRLPRRSGLLRGRSRALRSATRASITAAVDRWIVDRAVTWR